MNRCRVNKEKIKPTDGFTIGEMVIVIAVIAILAALIAPLAVNVVEQKRINTCKEELDIIKNSIIGDSSLVQGGTRSSYGFVGDIGALPISLDELVRRFQQPGDTLTRLAYPQNSGYGWYWGWRGPYVSEVVDPWGRNYYYQNNWPTGTPTFQQLPTILAAIWSAGPDGVNNNGTNDDPVVYIRSDEAFSQVSGNTFDRDYVMVQFTGQADPPGITTPITLDYPNGTSISHASLNAGYGTPPIYFFNAPIPEGIRSIRFNPSTAAQTLLIYIANGPMTVINLVDPL